MDTAFHSTLPSYYLPTNGTTLNRIAYSELFGVIGTIYGAGDTLTTFTLPNIANSVIKISSAPSGQLEIFPLALCLLYSSSILTVPANYIRTDGSEISRGVYADLYRVIKQTYGAGDGLTTFDLPTLSNRIMRYTNSVHITYMDGRVGIGENNPQYNLDVAGDINFTGSIYKNGIPWREDSTAPIPQVPWSACDADSSEDLVPVGSFVSFLSSATLPADYFLCDGSAISRTTYAQLFAVIGTNYGNGNGTTTFNLPLMFNMIIKYQSATGSNKSKVFIGSYMSYPWDAPLPAYYLQCDGSAVSRTTYAALFAVIGTAYGSGDGINTFNLPLFYNYIIKYGYPISGIDSLDVGLIISYGGSTAPTNYIFADGSEVSRHSYAELFDVISTGYGSGNGYTTFNLPALFAAIIRYTKNGTSVCYSGNVAIGKTTASYPLDVNGVVQAKNTPKAFLSMVLDYFSNPGTFKYSFLRSYNVSSVSYTSASGNVNVMTVNFTNSMSSRNYVIQATESPYYYNVSNSYITTGNYVSKLAITNYATGSFSCSLLGSTGQNLTPGRLDFVVYDSETNIYNGTPSGSAI
jgi:microcystin-dependent protein